MELLPRSPATGRRALALGEAAARLPCAAEWDERQTRAWWANFEPPPRAAAVPSAPPPSIDPLTMTVDVRGRAHRGGLTSRTESLR